MFDFDDIESEDPSAAVRLNFDWGAGTGAGTSCSRGLHRSRGGEEAEAGPVGSGLSPFAALPGSLGSTTRAANLFSGPGQPQPKKMVSLQHRMFVAKSPVTPKELTEIWLEWGVPYAERIRFLVGACHSAEEAGWAPVGKYLNPRLDRVPEHPEIVRLEAPSSILEALGRALLQHDPAAAAATATVTAAQEGLAVANSNSNSNSTGSPNSSTATPAVPSQPSRPRRTGGFSALQERRIGPALANMLGEAAPPQPERRHDQRHRGFAPRSRLQNGLSGAAKHIPGERRSTLLDVIGVRERVGQTSNSEAEAAKVAGTRASSTAASTPAPASPLPAAGLIPGSLPESCWYLGSSSEDLPQEMHWDALRGCFHINVALDGSFVERFQVWLEADPSRRLYPESDLDSSGGQCQGPDSLGKNRRWAIGDPGLQTQATGNYEVRVQCLPGEGFQVAWERVGNLFPQANPHPDLPSDATSGLPSKWTTAPVLSPEELKARQSQVLLAQSFEVSTEFVQVRAQASHDASVLGTKFRRDTFSGARETFDGWIKLDAAPGWILKQDGQEPLVRPLDTTPLLALPSPAPRGGPQWFQVENLDGIDGIDIFASPSTTARLVGQKQIGDYLEADAQGYNGWVRLVKRGGWVQTYPPEGAGTRVLRWLPEGRSETLTKI